LTKLCIAVSQKSETVKQAKQAKQAAISRNFRLFRIRFVKLFSKQFAKSLMKSFAKQRNTEHFAKQQLKREAMVDITLPDKGFGRKGLYLFRKTAKQTKIAVILRNVLFVWQYSKTVKRFAKR
jgi:hypothetical protein